MVGHPGLKADQEEAIRHRLMSGQPVNLIAAALSISPAAVQKRRKALIDAGLLDKGRKKGGWT